LFYRFALSASAQMACMQFETDRFSFIAIALIASNKSGLKRTAIWIFP
jgi:hypothetical protein